MKYRLKDLTNRNMVNLITHAGNIQSGVNAIFPNAVVKMANDYFEILNLPQRYKNSDFRNMGKEIAARDQILSNKAKIYNYIKGNGKAGVSIQVFERFLN